MLLHLVRKIVRRNNPVSLLGLDRSIPISSFFGLDRGKPIDRYYIDRFIQGNSQFITGNVLEIGDDHYSRTYSPDNSAMFDVLHVVPGNKKATLIGDLANPSSIPQDRFDCFVCVQTLNFIFEIQKAIAGIEQLLKPGGVLLASVSGISQISRYDEDRWGDYWRFTPRTIEKLFYQSFKQVEVRSFGNALAATALLQGICVEDLPNASLLDETDPDYPVIITVKAQK